jgi:N6-adenosine-specific RNA methylase IME4
MKAHPYANILPLLEGEAFDSLVADIRANGLMEPITIHEGMILDGRNRRNACKAAGVEPRFLEFDGDDPLAFVLSLNVHRRHLSESQRGMIAARLETLKHGDNQHKRGDANLHVPRADAAKRLNVSSRTVASAAAVRDHASPELVQAVDQGAIPVSVGAKLATASKDVQRRAVADPKRAHTIVGQASRAAREAELGRKAAGGASGRFGVLLIDPPWKFTARSDETGLGRSPESHYSTASVAEILKTVDVAAIAAEDAACFMWGLPHMCAEALELIAGWGFAVQTNLVWIKPSIGLGYLLRNRHELLWIGTKGNPPAPARGEQPDSVIEAPRGEHSEKPRAVHEMIERLFPTLPKIELFARGEARPGWSAWGNEAA